MTQIQKTISPVDGSVYVERELATGAKIQQTFETARTAQRHWRETSVAERAKICRAFVENFAASAQPIAEEITWQMGRPVTQAPGEIAGVVERASHMIDIAEAALADIAVTPLDGFTRFIRRQPLGVVFTVAPWNYPFLTSVNSIIPALMAGNGVVLKPSAQTPLSAERYAQAFAAAGLPEGVFQILHISHDQTAAILADGIADFVAFTGSVGGGRSIQASAANHFAGIGLELGGKDPAYVCADAPFDHTVESLVDGAFFNSGQSCCGIERIYVDAQIHDQFVEAFAQTVRDYTLGDPLDSKTNLGPLVRTSAADFVRGQTEAARSAGARGLIDSAHFSADQAGSPYLAPQVLIDVDHSMSVMTEESFGPVVGIMKVDDDAAAVALMNDSDFGLTASIWTTDEARALTLGDQVQTGTWFMNRCDYLDPALAWTGVKQSGRGATLSQIGYESLTRPQSFHLRTL